ncbi:MAG: flagellar biosynthesis protein FlhA [Alphaproteobacteria bacterium]|nr:flagellar biosynthesis protein FlhA [Alphaproteobacteria bacterium]
MAQAAALPASGGFDWNALTKQFARGEYALGVGVMALVIMLIVPIPAFLLDFLLAISITLSVLILMTSLLIRKPLEFSAFPTVLLLATLLRLALNIATTRLILSHGHQGPDAAGNIIRTFGGFVMQGNFVIGIVVFVILVIVNFIVVTKGSGRIAEVAARFTLDAMPGKQMAIDADLSAGMINEDEARQRRKDLEGESNFFGAMDGASKFVRGDAVAGILITFINIIGGMIIGVAQQHVSFQEAANSYTTLTVGDGIVSQIPALIVSIAAGMLVSKAGVEGAADKAIGGQLFGNPRGMAIVAGTALFAGLLPGMPKLPFALLAGSAGWWAWRAFRTEQQAAAQAAHATAEKERKKPVAEAPISESLAVDELKIELGFGLLGFINETSGRKLTDQVKAVRRQIASEFGFVVPQVRIIDNLELGSEEYRILVKEVVAGRGALRPRMHLAMDTSGTAPQMAGEKVTEPVFGLPAVWIDDATREQAAVQGYTLVDAATVLTTHFTEIVKENMAELLTFGGVKTLVDDLPKAQKTLIDDITPSQITMSGVQRVLQNLLRERVSIRDLSTILEAIAESSGSTVDLLSVTEHVRTRLARQLCNSHLDDSGALVVVALSPNWEKTFAEALIGSGAERQLALEPSRLHAFVADLRGAFERAAQSGDSPVLLTSGPVRPYVRSLVERFRPQTTVMSQNEIHPKARLRSAGAV